MVYNINNNNNNNKFSLKEKRERERESGDRQRQANVSTYKLLLLVGLQLADFIFSCLQSLFIIYEITNQKSERLAVS